MAIKGIGGFHLACDANNAEAVERLRSRKHRSHKPFALMARDVVAIENYAQPSDLERALLRIVLTSGNRSDEPQCISNEDARARLSEIADRFLMHDRDIVNRLDDSVIRVAGRTARGYAPSR